MNRQDAKKDLGGPICPICREPVSQAENCAFPFCSERCRTIDLGNWLGESYRIPTKQPASDDEGDDSSNSSRLPT